MIIEKIVFDEEKDTSLTAYIQEVGGEYRHVTKRPGILIIPGGAYQYCSVREGEPVAFEYLKAGFQAFIFLRDIFGCFEKGGMAAPKVRAHDTGDYEDYLSVYCTIGKLLSDQEGKSVMKEIMPGLQDGYEGWKRKMNEKYHTNLDIGQPIESYVLSTLWNMLERDIASLMMLQKKLEKIPNDQSL